MTAGHTRNCLSLRIWYDKRRNELRRDCIWEDQCREESIVTPRYFTEVTLERGVQESTVGSEGTLERDMENKHSKHLDMFKLRPASEE